MFPTTRTPLEFREIGRQLRSELGEYVLAIHHIGSTSVPGLAAKDVIDVQVTVADLDPSLVEPICKLGLKYHQGFRDHRPPGSNVPDEELEKLLFSNRAQDAADSFQGIIGANTNVHVRERGRFNQRYPLLCRDYLRARPDAAAAYGEIKRQLARRFPDDAEAYYDVKDPVFDVIMAGARQWSEVSGWREPPSDA